MKILRAIADGVLFTPEGVEQERGVIIREDYLRDGTTAQAWRNLLNYQYPHGVELRGPEVPALFGGTRLMMRSPIGTEATLRAATANNLRAFYERWYRPERMILTVVGDVTPAEAGQIVRRSFASLTGCGAPPAEIPVEDARNENGPVRHHVSRDAEPIMRLTLGHVLDRSGVDTAERRREAVARRLALAMFNHRLELLSEKPDAAFVSAEGMLGAQNTSGLDS